MPVIIRRPGQEPEVWEDGTQVVSDAQRRRLAEAAAADKRRPTWYPRPAREVRGEAPILRGPRRICGPNFAAHVHEWDVCWALARMLRDREARSPRVAGRNRLTRQPDDDPGSA